MTELINLFADIVENYGLATAMILFLMGAFTYALFKINKNYSSVLKKFIETREINREKEHTNAALYRKKVTPKIRRELRYLAEGTKSDRAILFEFSNGNSNLMGLPFLYTTATCEVVTSCTDSVSHKYQKVNTSLIASFLEKLEGKGYFYAADIEEIKEQYPTLYAFMKPNRVKSMLFYSLYGVDDTIGFIVITTTEERTFTRDETISKIANTAQIISSLLNFNAIHNNE
jgi:hypothetical protein